MSDLIPKFKVGRKEIVKDRALKFGVWALPVVLALLPSIILFVLFILFGTTKLIAASFYFWALFLHL